MSLDLTSGKASHRDDPQARKPACCRYRRLLLRATRTWPYHSDAHAHTDPSLNRICIREFFCRVFLPRSFTVLSSDEYGIRKAESMVLLFFRAARIRFFPVQIMIHSINISDSCESLRSAQSFAGASCVNKGKENT